MPLRALRGATTIDVDEVGHLTDRMVELLTELFARNDIDHDHVVSIIFTATDDIRCTFPATRISSSSPLKMRWTPLALPGVTKTSRSPYSRFLRTIRRPTVTPLGSSEAVAVSSLRFMNSSTNGIATGTIPIYGQGRLAIPSPLSCLTT